MTCYCKNERKKKKEKEKKKPQTIRVGNNIRILLPN
jgi:hypothetical protein